MTSGERGRTVTALFCMSALGNFVPPMMIYPRVRMNLALQHNGPEGLYKCSRNGWSNEELFCEWLEHFIMYVKPTEGDPALLIMDNHASHVSLPAYEICKKNHIVVITLPPHTTHVTQPLDVAFFGPFKKTFRQEIEVYLSSHSYEKISEHFLAEFVNNAFKAVACIYKGISGFKATGIWPLNSTIFERELSVANRINAANEPKKNSPTVEIFEEAAAEKIIKVTINNQPRHAAIDENQFNDSSSKSSSILQSLMAMPKKLDDSVRVQRKSRPKMKSEIFTLSPQKENLENAVKKRKRKEDCPKKKESTNKQTQEKGQLEKGESVTKRPRGRQRKVQKTEQDEQLS